MYQLYKCRCKKEFILITEYIDDIHFIRCPYCSSKNVRIENEYESLKECLKGTRTYKKVNGRWRELR